MVFDAGNIAWVLISTAMILLMVPAVAFFYGGMLRKSSVLSMLGQSLLITGVITLLWVIVGYSLVFNSDYGGFIGGLDYVMLHGVDALTPAPMASSIPHLLFMMFQGMFAIITVALIIGGTAERLRLKAFVLFVILWSLLVYDPVAHWIWGGGWLQTLGVLDFAGGIVIHITAGVSVLAAALILGKRASVSHGISENPHNIPTVVLGGALLWFGWFGFNGGSALSAGSVAINAFVVSQISAATATVVWGTISWLHLGRPSVLGLISGAIAGLAAITPAAGYVDTSGAIAIGFGAGVLCYGGILLRKRMGFDDALDVWGVHGVAGTFGALMIGLLATSSVNDAVVHNGLLYGGDAYLLGVQALAVGVVWAVSFAITFIVLKVIGAITPLRMTKEEERIGADLIQHGETAYS
ncbi:MAG: ammonium transporter [Methanomassiliicoccus sp.]|nr:ammonium transporter [Methanomassiliicoccus sp.]